MTTIADKEHMDKVSQLGCRVCINLGYIRLGECPAGIHHTGTYMGGGRTHKRVLALCHEHHQGKEGIDGKHMSKRQWEAKFGTEEELLSQQEKDLLCH